MLRIGLTGGIGSGKSTVASEFQRLGVTVFDLDQIAREVVEPHTEALKKIAGHFGNQVLDSNGQLDRGKLRAIIFEDPVERKWLENLLHPLIRQRQMDLESKTKSPYVVIEIPLLVENIESQQVDRILVIEVPTETQIERTMLRSSILESDVKKVIASQATSEERREVAHDLIKNHGSEEDLVEQIKTLHQSYLELAVRASR